MGSMIALLCPGCKTAALVPQAFAGAKPPTTAIATSMRPYRNVARRITWLEIRRSLPDSGF